MTDLKSRNQSGQGSTIWPYCMKNIKAKVITCIHAMNSFIKIMSIHSVFFATVSKGESAAKLLLYPTDPLTKLASTIRETSCPPPPQTTFFTDNWANCVCRPGPLSFYKNGTNGKQVLKVHLYLSRGSFESQNPLPDRLLLFIQSFCSGGCGKSAKLNFFVFYLQETNG